MGSAFNATAFARDTAEAASTQWRAVADQVRPKVSKLATIMDDSEHDVLAYRSFPKEHRAKLHSTNPIEPLNMGVKRRAEVVMIPSSTCGQRGVVADLRRSRIRIENSCG